MTLTTVSTTVLYCDICLVKSRYMAVYYYYYYYYFKYFFKPSKNEGRKKIEKVKKNGEAMFRAVVQLKTIVQQNRIETK